MKKTLTVVLTAAVVASAFWAVPAEAKKKPKKPKTPPPCAAYVPGEVGSAAESLIVTDAATAEAPATFDFSLPEYFLEGIDGGQPMVPLNVQVDTALPSAGLYVTWEFPRGRDYDLWAFWPDGTEAASSHGFQPAIEANADTPAGNPSNTASNHAGESTDHSENIVGVITPDCGGYTLRMDNYLGEGGDLQLKVWLGEGVTEPKPMGG